MHQNRRRTQRVPQLQWLEDCLDWILRTLAQILWSLVPGRR